MSQDYPFIGIYADTKYDMAVHIGGCKGACMCVGSEAKGKFSGPRGADNKVEEVLWSELYVYVDELV